MNHHPQEIQTQAKDTGPVKSQLTRATVAARDTSKASVTSLRPHSRHQIQVTPLFKEKGTEALSEPRGQRHMAAWES